MANRREKMDRADRAKQFMPFDALKGFREALAQKEEQCLKGTEISDMIETVSFKNDRKKK